MSNLGISSCNRAFRWLIAMYIVSCFFSTYGFGAQEYTADGEVHENNEVIRWLINRTRFAPEREADRLGLVNNRPGSDGNFDVAEDAAGDDDFTSTAPGDMYEWSDWAQSRGPFAPNAKLSEAASNHGLDLAETQTFQHASPSSTYYAEGDGPADRQAKEGYINTGYHYTENLLFASLGYSNQYPDESITPEDTHENLFIDEPIEDRGHRKTILNFVCTEIGMGHNQDRRQENIDGINYYFTTDYYTYDVGRRTSSGESDNHFFTGTIFNDANGDDSYQRGEGVGGIDVRLYQGGIEHSWYDRSSASGSFAVPIDGLEVGSPVEVELYNSNASTQTVSIAMTYDSVAEIIMAPGASFALGHFTQPDGITNVGFRNIDPGIGLDINCTQGHVGIAFDALIGLIYEVQIATDLTAQNWETVQVVTADENSEVVTCSTEEEPLPAGAAFRVVWLKSQN